MMFPVELLFMHMLTFQSQFLWICYSMLALPTPSTRSLQHIYQVQLGKYLHEGDFVPEVKDALFSFVSGSIAIYYRMCNEMLPTPTKIHYTFNIRDLSQVCKRPIMQF